VAKGGASKGGGTAKGGSAAAKGRGAAKGGAAPPAALADPRDPEGALTAEFARLDLHGTGALTPAHVHAGLFAAGWDYDEVFGVFAKIDRGGKGHVDKGDFLDFRARLRSSDGKDLDVLEQTLKKRCEERGMGVDLVSLTTELLRKYDEDKDGALDRRELARFVRSINDEEGVLSDNEFGQFVKEALEEHDLDADKKLAPQEFLAFYKSFILKVVRLRSCMLGLCVPIVMH